MADSVVSLDNERRLQFGKALINRLARRGLLTATLVQAASGVQNLVDRIAAALLTSSNENYPPEVTAEVRYLVAEIVWRFNVGDLSAPDTTVAGLLTVRGTSADTDLRYLWTKLITDASDDAADESFVDGAFGASSYTANLT